jgi:hypothetical protein
MLLDTHEIEKPIFVIVVLILAATIAYAGYNYGHVNTTTNTVVVTPTIAPTPVPTPTTPAAYWTGPLLVTELTTGAGWPESVVSDGRGFQISYSDYDNIYPQDRVSFYVVSTINPYGTVIYVAQAVNIVSHSWSNTRYYYWDNHYYRDDNRVTVEVTRDEATRNDYKNEKPSHWRE